MLRMHHQFTRFVVVGLAAAVAHYSVLVGLVELGGQRPVPATLAGYVVGGTVSYLLNRRYSFTSDRPHREALWRFTLVAGVGFVVTWVVMALLTRHLHLPYLPAQVLTTGVVMLWSFSANRIWTFREPPVP
jgi:putative flippase GtrA